MPLPNEDRVPGHLTTPPRRVRAAREALPVTHPPPRAEGRPTLPQDDLISTTLSNPVSPNFLMKRWKTDTDVVHGQ